jgi:outer membrane lipoprotein-sorting protein
MTSRNIQLVLLTILVAFPTIIFAQITGQQVIENVYNRETGDDLKGEITMSLINSRGDERVREIKQFSKNYKGMEKKIMFFMAPADVRNTSFMNWSYDEIGKNDDQWIYLPALKKVKRISSDSKSDYFMGSDFTYDDLGDRHPTDDTHKILREEKLNGENCFVIESIYKDEEYMYSRTVTWIIKYKWIGMKKEFYDEDEDLLKILTIKKYEKIGGFWIILNSEMINVQKKHTTKMILSNIFLDSGVPDDKFTERMMKRGL